METLLLPGMDGTGWLFREFRLQLAGGSLRLHTVAFPRTQAFSYEFMATHMKLPPGPFVLIAESFSGPIAVRIAQLRPGQVRAIILAATFVRNPAGLATHLGALLGPILFGLPLPRFALRRMLLDDGASDKLVAAVAEAVRATRPHVLAARLREIARVDVREAFRSLAMPVLVLAGKRDRLVRPETIRDMVALRPDLKVEWLDAPHLILQTRAEESANAISRFLAAVV